MLLKGIRRMYGLRFQGQRRWAHHFLLVIWLSLLAATPPGVFGYFLGDTKAVLNGCKDHWTLQDRAAMPLLFQMTVCVDIRVVVPGAWVAFSYSSVHAPQPELGLEGDDGALYGWLLRVRHRFPLRLSPAHWHRVCLRRDVPGNSFSLEVDGKMVAERTVIAQAIPPSGSLWLGCRPRDRPPGAVLGEVEVYLFRIWADLGDHGLCEDGTVIGWNAQFWGLTSPNARQRDPNLMCVHRRLKRGARGYRSINGVMSAHTTGFGRSFSPPPDVHSPTTTSSPVIATPVTDTRNQTEFTASTSPGGTTVYSSQPLSVTPSTNVTSPTTLSELDPTTDSTTADWTPSNTTVPATGEKTKSDPAPVSPIASHQTATADVMSPTVRSTPPSNASPPNQMSTSTKTSSITTLPHKQTTPRRSLMSGSSLVNCDISKLCSDEKAYFWMFISVEAKGGSKTEQDVHSLVSKAFGCGNDRAETGFIDFCQGNRQAQVIEVNCRAKRNISDTNCHVLLQLTHAVSACELQHAGISALQRAGDEQIQARIIGEVERVGRDLCGDMSSPSGGFVRCTSSSSLDDICQANQHSNLTCSLIEPNSIPAPQPKTEPCGREAPRFCDCTAFCNSASQFFAIRLNINSAAVNISLLQKLLSSRLCNTGTGSECQEISKHYKGAHLECHGTQHRLYSCMVIMEMSGPVSGCSLSKLLQQLIDSNSDITNERPLTRMVVCGPPGLPVHDLLASNLTWVASDLLTSDTCQPDPTLLKCEANETLAVLLSDSCPPKPLTTNPSTAHPSTQTKSNITTATEATASTVTNTTQQTNATSENTPATHQENASQGTTQPYMTTPFSVYNSTQSSTAQPVLQTSSQNVTVYVSNNTTPQNTTSSDKATLLTPTENTKLQNTTAAQQNTSESITLSSVSSTPPNTTTSTNNLQNATTICMNSTLNTTTLSPNHTTEYNVTTADTFTPSPNDTTTTANTFTLTHNATTEYNVTTISAFTPSPNHTTEYNVTTADTFTPSPNDTTLYNVTTADTFTTSPNNTMEYNVTTANTFTLIHNATTAYNVTTISAFTPSPNDTTVYNITTADSFTPTPNDTTEYNITTINAFTPTPNDTTEYNITTSDTFTLTPNATTEYNITTANIVTPSPNDTILYNVTTADTFTTSPNNTMEYNVTTISAFTPSPNDTTVYNITTTDIFTPSPNDTTLHNATTADTFTPSPNDTTEYNITTANAFTPSPNHTAKYNLTTADTFTPTPNVTRVYNVTTAEAFTSSYNHTTEYNLTTANTFTPSPNHTKMYNVTTAINNGKLHNSTNSTRKPMVSTFTASPNHTIEYNATTASNNYTTKYNVTTASNNYTTEYNATTASNNYTTVYNVTTASNNYTTKYNVTTASNNYTTKYNVTTASNNYTTVDNKTAAISNLHNGTSNATISAFTASPNYTTVYNVTTASKNYTTASNNFTVVYNVTTAGDNMNSHNITITSKTTISTLTTSSNYTMMNNETTASNNYTTAENITTTTISQNKTTADNVTTAPIRGTQQNTTVPYKNTTVSTTARPVNETPYNATTSTKNSTVDNMTSVVDNTTKTTVAPLNNQTTNYTTVSVPNNSATTNRNYTNSTTPASGFSPTSNLNTTAGTSFNLSSTASSLTTEINITTKGPGVNLTIAANTSLEDISTTSTSTMTTTATTAHGQLPAQDNTTTATVSLPSTTTTTTLQTTTLTSTTNTIAGTGITSTTTEETINSQVAQDEQADALLNETQDASRLNSSQVVQLVGNLEKLLDGPAVSQTVGEKTINIVSNLMQVDSEALSASANRLIQLVDILGLKLAVTGDRAILSSNSLVLAVRTVDGTNFPTTSVNIFNTNNVQFRGLSRSQSGSSQPSMGSIFLPSSITEGLSPEEQQQASRVQFTFYTKSTFFQDAALKNQTLVSPVLGSSVANMSISNLKENIQFTIQNTNPIHANFVASCVFWDFTLNGGGGGWSSAGCSLVNATPEDTTCSCNHLTSFAILLDMSRQEMTDRQQAQILTFITYIGCGVSAIFLAVTILTYLSFQKLLRDIPAKILVQLCMSLFLLNLVFLLDGWLALYPATGLCISTAFFLHYFLLTSFTWAGLEALHMYLSIVQVFTPYLSRYMLKFTLMGWVVLLINILVFAGIPLTVVIVVISVDKDNYGLVTYGKYTDGTSDDFCWLRNDIAFYVGVVAYFILIFVLCLLVFIVVMVQLARIKKQNPQNQSPNRGVMTDLRSIAGLILLLGLTWGFALFAWGPLYLPFVYLFSIFNSLQGFFIFVFHCAVKENVRKQWRTYLCCGKLRLAENSEWSRTATQNNRNLSVTTATTSALHLTSRSSSVISDSTNSSGSVFVDSGISDGSNSDVVLNELHRRNLSPQTEA